MPQEGLPEFLNRYDDGKIFRRCLCAAGGEI